MSFDLYLVRLCSVFSFLDLLPFQSSLRILNGSQQSMDLVDNSGIVDTATHHQHSDYMVIREIIAGTRLLKINPMFDFVPCSLIVPQQTHLPGQLGVLPNVSHPHRHLCSETFSAKRKFCSQDISVSSGLEQYRQISISINFE